MMPFEVPDPNLGAAVARAGAFAVMDVGRRDPLDLASLWQLANRTDEPCGLRVPPASRLGSAELPENVTTVVLRSGAGVDTTVVDSWRPRRVVVEITTADEAVAACAAGADGLVVKGAESGGRIGEHGAFVLLQHVVQLVDVPCWCQGGIGLHTAAAAIAGGAAGVVLDAQLARTKEATAGRSLGALLDAMDGSETAVVGRHRVFTRPDLELPGADITPEAVERRLGTDLKSELLPIGQDGAFAASLARRFPTAGSLVHAVRGAIDRQLRLAGAQSMLAENAPLAARYGLRYPIAQGPMTRVSDRPAFAAAVAENGALPFLALALMEPDAVERLLEETAELLGDHAWGVGILGFVPPELRAGQLAAIQRVGPPVALIAGGRPSQARPLEEAGTATFLHVPSPGLLKLFLREGARRFVFEGRECGGHVGPRSSFVLWEQQVETLLHSDVNDVEVLFAGGIHDARSSAMVAALAAPLAEAGARVGVLMGTAYLFTDEAVEAGAIQPAFQDVAVRCERTTLLETGPGHATRCADTAFARTFEAERRRLEGEGVPAQERWAALEDLNLGRLRIAAKGISRDGERYFDVNDEAQRRDGMYMIGEVAALRSSATSMAALHDEVSRGSTEVLAAAQPPQAEQQTRPLDVAIVGMACVFPDAEDGARYWSNIVDGHPALREVSKDRWDPSRNSSTEWTGARGTPTPSRWGGFLPPVAFDPMRFGIPPRSLGSIETSQLLSLEVASRALADAGYEDREFDRSRTSVVFGAEGASELATAYGFRALVPTLMGAMPPALDERLPALTEDSFPGVLTNVIAGRIANRLDLGGANYTVDAACAASLAALRLACGELATGESDMALCGGVDLHNGIFDYQLFASVHALSPTGRPRPFDAESDGIALGEGVACVVLKRLSDAERDGDRIYAVIKGVGAASDGRSLGLTAPRAEGQRAALERAYRQAGLSPAAVGLVEAHGTGTVVGDRTELATLTEVFKSAGSAAQSCTLGSVKAQIGHTKCAAGLAGLIKAARAVYHGIRPGAPHVTRPLSSADAESPFAFSSVSRPWSESRRIAGVSAFGFGGANFHVVLSSHDAGQGPRHGLSHWPAELVVLRGEAAALRQSVTDLAVRVENELSELAAPGGLRELAAEQWRRGAGPVRVAIVAADGPDLLGKLRRVEEQLDRGHPTESSAGDDVFLSGGEAGPGVAFLFPGQGSQRPGMLGDLFMAFPRLAELLQSHPDAAALMFPPTSQDPERSAGQAASLTDTKAAQPALGIAGLAVATLLGDLGVVPDAVGGHSYGELVALCAAGVFGAEELLKLSDARANAITASVGEDPGTMAAVSAPAESVRRVLDGFDGVMVANDNAPNQVAISGGTQSVRDAVERLKEHGMAARMLAVSCGFHSELVHDARRRFGSFLTAAQVHPPHLAVWSNWSAGPYPSDPDEIRTSLAEQVASPVRFREQVESMYAAGLRTFVEAGPGNVLCGLVGRILEGRPHRVLAVDRSGVHGIRQLLRVVGALAVAGVPVDLDPLFAGRVGEADRRTTRGWLIEGPFVRSPDGTPSAEGLRPTGAISDTEAELLTSPFPSGAVRVEAGNGLYESDEEVLTGNGYGQIDQEDQLVEVPRTVPGQAGTPVVDVGRHEASAVHQDTMAPRDRVMIEHLRGLREIVYAQGEAMALYFGAQPEARQVVETRTAPALGRRVKGGEQRVLPEDGAPEPAAGSVEHAEPLSADVAGAPAGRPASGEPAPADGAVTPAPAVPAPTSPPSATPLLGRGELLSKVTAIVSDSTGYPLDMLGADLDLEADLSIDSIKRIEIIGALASDAGVLGEGAAEIDDATTEELASRKTLTDIVDWVLSARGADTPQGTGAQAVSSHEAPSVGAPSGGAASGGPDPRAAASEGREPSSDPSLVATGAGSETGREAGAAAGPPAHALRYEQRVEHATLPVESPGRVAGATVAVTDDGTAISAALASELGDRGAQVRMIGKDLRTGDADVVVHVSSLSATPPPLPDVVSMAVRAIHDGGTRTLVFVSGAGGCFGREIVGDGPHGLLPGVGLRAIAKTLGAEYPDLTARCVDVSPKADPRMLARQIAAELLSEQPLAEVGYQDQSRHRLHLIPEPLSQDGRPGIDLGAGSVVLLTGGARGITGRLSRVLARRGCLVELVGRTQMPSSDEDGTTAQSDDPRDIRRELVAAGWREPGEIEARIHHLLAQRELSRTLTEIAAEGRTARYHSADVRDADAMGAIVSDIYERHGRLDVVVHGAGVLEDRLARDKKAASFDEVFSTKVEGARVLLSTLRSGTRAVVFFGSVAGVFGNRGQVDYAAANEALEAMAWQHNGVTADRVLCVHFGPWAGTGMTSPEVARAFEQRGIGLIDPEDGVAALLRELALGPPSVASIVLMRANPAELSVVTSQ